MSDETTGQDALEELRAWLIAKPPHMTAQRYEWLKPIVAAWEKERADVKAEREAHGFLLTHRAELRDALVALRSEVQAVEEEMRTEKNQWLSLMPSTIQKLDTWADRLRRARGGQE